MNRQIASLIPTRYLRTLLVRGWVIWAVARIMGLVLYLLIAASADREMAAAFTQGNPVVLMGWTLALTAALVRVDLQRRHEVALLNNLGVFTSHAVTVGIVPALVMETALAILR